MVEMMNDSITTANALMLLSQGGAEMSMNRKRTFDCRTCNKQFPSFQALGGHRASHKKQRLPDDDQSQTQDGPRKPKVHECSICGLEFAIGQALGGHMRRHRASTTGEGFDHGVVERKSNGKRVLLLDLNLPPDDHDDDSDADVKHRESGLRLGLGLYI